jgi:glycerate 2-kinase
VPLALVAPDKFRGTVTATEAAAAMARGASASGWAAHQRPLADGGEGLLEVLEAVSTGRGAAEVTGPLGRPVRAGWIRVGNLAIVEMAQASGLALVGGATGNDAVAASSRGTGELIVAAARALSEAPNPHGRGVGMTGADTGGWGSTPTVVVGLGGSATTDGGLGAVEAIDESGGLGGTALVGACDVDVDFLEAARQFSAQKGADAAQTVELEARLRRVAGQFEDRFGVDVLTVEGAGSAGGLGGAIVALGGRLRSGYAVVSELLGVPAELTRCQLVVTGEGALDSTSFAGKVVGSLLRDAAAAGVRALVVAGRTTPQAVQAVNRLGAHVVSLTDVFGEKRALGDTATCIETAVADAVGSGSAGPA